MRFGILGTANIARIALIPAIRAAHDASVVAVASRDRARALAFADANDIPVAHDYESLLADDAIDAIYVPLPNSMHREWTVRALERGRHVLCEKPLAPTEDDCRAMIAAQTGGARLMEAFMYRFHPRIDRVLDMIRAGSIGEVRAIRSTFTFRLTRPDNIRMRSDLGGGALLDVGCYCVNVARTVAGAEPVDVQATAIYSGTGVDEQLAGTLRFGSGIIATFDCALTLERRESCEIAGTDGTLILPAAFLPGTADAPIILSRGRLGEEVFTVPGADQYRLMVEHFVDAIAAGRPFRYPAAEAALNVRTLEALHRSARANHSP